MSSVPRRKARRVTVPLSDSLWNIKTIASLAVSLACVALLLFGITKLKQSRVESLPKEFEGRIVDKWARISESEQGSSSHFRLIVEVDGQNVYTVPVNNELYQDAQVGMRLKRSEKGLELIRGPNP